MPAMRAARFEWQICGPAAAILARLHLPRSSKSERWHYLTLNRRHDMRKFQFF
jgi:hypothetical protein